MNDFALSLVTSLARTTLWMTAAALVVAAALRISGASSPRTHRLACLAVLAVGWSFVRLPLAVPWHAAAPVATHVSPRDAQPPPAQPHEQAGFPAESSTGDPIGVPSLPPEPLHGLVVHDRAPAVAASPSQSVAAAPTDSPRVTAVPPAAPPRWYAWSAALWLAGVVVWPLVWLAGYVGFVYRLRHRQPASDVHRHQWQRLLAEAGVRRQIPLTTHPRIGPVLCRLPRGYELVVPAALWESLDARQRESILRHELAHFQRGDLAKSLAARLLAVPHWFNPATWWAVRRFDEAAEWACDAAAVQGGTTGTAHTASTDYARALVCLGESSAYGASYGPAARGHSLATRVRRILAEQPAEDTLMKKAALVTCGLLLLAGSLVQVRLVARQPQSNSEPAATAAADTQPAPAVTETAVADDLPRNSPATETQPESASDSKPKLAPASATDGPPAEGTAGQDKFIVELPADAAALQAEADLQKQLVAAARDAFQANRQAYAAGNVPMSALHDWSLRWLQAESGLTASPAARTAAAQAHLERMREVQKAIQTLHAVGNRGGEPHLLGAANYYVAEAQQRLATARSAQRSAGALGGPTIKSAAAEPPREGAFELKVKIEELEADARRAQMQEKLARLSLDAAAKVPGSVTSIEIAKKQEQVAVARNELARAQALLALYKARLKQVEQLAEQESRDPAASQLSQSVLETSKPVLGTWKPQTDSSPPLGRLSPPAAAGPLYDGKDFDYWRRELEIDLSPERRAGAIRALAAFGANGRGADVARAIMSAMRGYSVMVRDNSPLGGLKQTAIDEFACLPLDETLPVLKEALASDSANQRLFVAMVLYRMATMTEVRDQMTPVLHSLLDSPAREARMAAASTLLHWSPTDPEVVKRLRTWLVAEAPADVSGALQLVSQRYSPFGFPAGGMGGVTIPPPDMSLLEQVLPELLALLDRPEPISGQARQVLSNLHPATLEVFARAADGAPDAATRELAERVLDMLRERYKGQSPRKPKAPAADETRPTDDQPKPPGK